MDDTAPEPVRTWRPVNNGAGKRIWFLIADDETLPVGQRYHYDRRGWLIRYASHATASKAAARLNAAQGT